jgi:methylenetetrahydrofolate dehydrogenase (NADP+)/methenyltetrahydrofolate cyclohydrolase
LALLLEGKPVARDIFSLLRDDIAQLVTRHGQLPHLAVVKVGDDPGSAAYARAIRRSAKSTGIPFQLVELDSSTGIEDFDREIGELNRNDAVAGIMVLQPLPRHLPRSRPSEIVDPDKDVDGMTLLNIGRLESGTACLVPSTPRGGIEILCHYDIPVAGRHAVIVGRSNVVGKPLASMLLSLDATVTICHSKTPDLSAFTRSGDIVALAAGKPSLLDASMLKRNAVVLDFGVNLLDGVMTGDADPTIADVAGAFTPVPGGTGVVTNAVLMRNTVTAIKNVLSRSRC